MNGSGEITAESDGAGVAAVLAVLATGERGAAWGAAVAGVAAESRRQCVKSTTATPDATTDKMIDFIGSYSD